jgi:hypothetical protein
VPEQFLDTAKVGTTFEQVRSVGVPEHVRVQRPPIGQWMALQDAPGIPWGQALSPLIEENGIRGALRPGHHAPPVAQPRPEGGRGRRAEGQPADLRALAEDGQGAALEVAVPGVSPQRSDTRPVP